MDFEQLSLADGVKVGKEHKIAYILWFLMVSVYFWDAKWNYTFQGGNFVNCFVNYVSQNDKVGPNKNNKRWIPGQKCSEFISEKNKKRHIYWHFALQKTSVRDAVEEYLKPER